MHVLKKIKIFNLDPSQVLVLGFAIVIFVGSFLLNLPIASKSGESIGFVNALFTATSAVCVTGLVVVDTATHWTIFGQVIILLLIQVGGLGFMTITTLIAFVMGRRIMLKERLLMQEALNQQNISGIVRLTRYVLLTTVAIEGTGALLLSIRFIPLYGLRKGIGFSIFHAVSAFCNAGFDLMGDFQNLIGFVNDPLVSLVICGLIVLGGLGFMVIVEITKKKSFWKLSLHAKLVLLLTGILIGTGFITILFLEFNNPNTMKELPLKGKILSALFHSISPRTAGFNTLPMADLTIATVFLTILLMFIGGSPSSTAGGIKTSTAGVLIWTIIAIVKGEEDTNLFKKRIPRSIIDRALAVTTIAMLWVILITMLLSIVENGKTFMEMLFETVSAFATVGLSLGITTKLSFIGKLLIALTMFTGRVGPLTVVLALARRQHKKKGHIRYPEEKVIVG